MSTIKDAMTKDPDYAWSWFCNVAMASIDEGMEYKAAQRAAARFMYNAFEQDMTKHRRWKAEWDEKACSKDEIIRQQATLIESLNRAIQLLNTPAIQVPAWNPEDGTGNPPWRPWPITCNGMDPTATCSVVWNPIGSATPRGEVEG